MIPVEHSDRDWGASGRVLTVAGFAMLMATLTVTVTSSSAFVLMVGVLALRAAFTALAELDAAIRDAEV